jgi:hypothetical protein
MIYKQEYKTKEKVVQSYIREYKGYKDNIEKRTKQKPFFPCWVFFFSMP